MRQHAEVFPPGEFIRDELDARGWSLMSVHAKLGNDPVRCCAFDLAAFADDKKLILDGKTVDDLVMLFGGDRDYWINLDRAWRSANPKTPPPVRCFMDGIDWQHHLESDPGGTNLFPSVENCREGKGCLKRGGGCGIVEVEVRLIRWAEEQFDDSKPTTTKSQPFWKRMFVTGRKS